MRNLPLLRFLAAVEAHAATSKTLMDAAGYDPLELQLAVAIATEEGFVQPTGQIHPSLRLTAAGRVWATEELAPFASLFPGASQIGAASAEAAPAPRPHFDLTGD